MRPLPPVIAHCALALACTAVAPATIRAESLWTAVGSREQSLYSDPKASRVGDILTIIVAESAAQTSTQSKQTNSSSSANFAVDQFLFPPGVSRLGTHNGALPGMKLGGGKEFSGGGAVNQAQSVTTRAAVLVSDVLPNGNLVVTGARRTTFAGETQHVVLRGIVRPADISSLNTVVSSNLAEASVEFISDGTLADAQKRGWLTRLYDKLRPF